MTSSLLIETKRATVLEHFSKAYNTVFKRELTDAEVEKLYKDLMNLRKSEQAHRTLGLPKTIVRLFE